MMHRLSRSSPRTKLFASPTSHPSPAKAIQPTNISIQEPTSYLPWRSVRRPLETSLRTVCSPILRKNSRGFHSTPQNYGGPLLLFAALLKSSASLEFARTASRIALTFVPAILVKNSLSRNYLRKVEKHNILVADEKRPLILRGIRNRTLLFRVLVLTPFILFWATLVASLEKTPLTGRWRIILLSPEEEDQISAQLAGSGWYRAVSDVLCSQQKDGNLPATITRNDRRYQWVENTLRRLESAIPVLQDESLAPNWLAVEQLPPPAEHPLRPRPRVSEYLRRMSCVKSSEKIPDAPAHTVAGPPYSLLIVDQPGVSNAFSYGFGPNGGGGIVLFTGFLDEITKSISSDPIHPTRTSPERVPWWSSFFGFLTSAPLRPPHVIPTPEQTSQLAVLLAHELSHLILAHHLESLSSASIIVPGILSIATDMLRALLFPVTMVFGPFVNDAVADIGKIGSGEALKLGMLCSSRKQEVEADIVSMRLLAYAGFDPHSAIEFWQNRQDITETMDCGVVNTQDSPNRTEPSISSIFRLFGDLSHPMNNIRVDTLKRELERWRIEKQLTLPRLINEDTHAE